MGVPVYRQALGLAKETTWGTGVTATTFLPVKRPSGFVPQFEDIDDDGFRNNAARLQGAQQGVGMTPFDTGEMMFYGDDSVHFLMGLFGVDTISGAGPYTHPLTLLNTGDPPSYTLTLFDNLIATARQITGARFNEVILKWSTKTKLTIQAKGIGKIATTVAKPTEAYSTVLPYTGWNLAVQLSGGANTKVEQGEIKFARPVEFIFPGASSQDAQDYVIDQMAVTGSLELAIKDDTEKAYYTGYTTPAGLFTFTSNTASTTLAIQMTKMRFGKGSDIDRSQKYQRLKLPFEAIANATDAGTGNAPAKVTAVNAKAAAY